MKDNSEFTFKLAIVDGQLLSVKEISDLATMPGKEELFSKLLFLIQSPAQRLATVINATGRDLAVVLGQGVEKEKFAAGPAPVAAAPAPTEAPASESVAPAETGVAAEPEIAAAHAAEAPTPEEAIAANPASEADPAQPENGTASQAGEAANTDPAEGA